MFITRKHLSRRTVLKGAGVSLALPLLDAMVPAATALGQTAAAPKMRPGFFYIPHGAIMHNTAHGPAMDRWTPRGAGADFQLSPILGPLEPYKDYVTSFANLENKALPAPIEPCRKAAVFEKTRIRASASDDSARVASFHCVTWAWLKPENSKTAASARKGTTCFGNLILLD